MHLARFALLSAVWVSTVFGQAPAFEKWLTLSRVVNELEAQLKIQPHNRLALEEVAAVQHLAFSVQVAEFHVFGGPGMFDVVLPNRIAREANGKLEWAMLGNRLPSSSLVDYALGGLVAYERALTIYPLDAKLWLGYAGLLEDVRDYCFGKPADQFPPEFNKIRVPFLREVYAVAFHLGLRDDFLRGTSNYVDVSVAYPAALGTLRMAKSASPALSPQARQNLEEYTRMVEAKGLRVRHTMCDDRPGFSPIRSEMHSSNSPVAPR